MINSAANIADNIVALHNMSLCLFIYLHCATVQHFTVLFIYLDKSDCSLGYKFRYKHILFETLFTAGAILVLVFTYQQGILPFSTKVYES